MSVDDGIALVRDWQAGRYDPTMEEEEWVAFAANFADEIERLQAALEQSITPSRGRTRPMSDDLVERARRSDGIERFTASDGLPAFRADTTLINELADAVYRLERVVEFAAAHGPETCPGCWPEGCARAVVSMAQRSIPDPTYDLAGEEGKADE